MAVNARDAMPQGGKLVVETRNIVIEADQTDVQSELEPGEYVQLSISDTGVGMTPEIRDRVFEPFFTTKEKGRGTGLGLAMVYGFVKQSGGHVTIYSEVGHGTTINLYLPRADRAPITKSADRATDNTALPKRETILVVEDDDRVRQLTIKRLKLIGYRVLEASDGPRALEILRRGETVHLVFTDLVMPGGLSGREVAIQAREIVPGIRVLLTSGYAEELVRGDELQRERLKVLRKPYQQSELVAALREVLGGIAGHP
jgi:CheY-like chemotaxis protein